MAYQGLEDQALVRSYMLPEIGSVCDMLIEIVGQDNQTNIAPVSGKVIIKEYSTYYLWITIVDMRGRTFCVMVADFIGSIGLNCP